MSTPITSPVVTVDIPCVNDVCLRIEVAGGELVPCPQRPPRRAASIHPEAPDPVRLFAEASALGMFPSASIIPWESNVEWLNATTHPETGTHNWELRLRNIDPGGYRVLLNLLLARLPRRVAFIGNSKDTRSDNVPRIMDPLSLKYPDYYKPVPFDLDYEMPERMSRNRYVHLMFHQEPNQAVLEQVYSALDKWSKLLIFGGYPAEDMKPHESSAGPDPAFLLDSKTVEQPFPDLFLCDDVCYGALINWCHVLHQSQFALEALILR